ncbi:S8 family peptidase [bacterium]|nr:S8 family peptidase [bacterium]
MNTDAISRSSYLNAPYNSSPVVGGTKQKASSKEAEVSAPKDGFEKSSPEEGAVKNDDLVRFIVSLGSHPKTEDVQSFLSAQKEIGAKVSDRLDLVDAYTLDVKSDNIGDLFKSLPEGASVTMDATVGYKNPLMKNSDAPSVDSVGKAPPKDISDALIGIDEVWKMGFTGKGQTIAVIDSGIAPHPDLKDKIVGWVDMQSGALEPTDTYGHGTHVAGVAAGTGIKSAGVHKGVAPDANLVGVRIGSVSEAIKGIQWCIEHKDQYNIGVINMSLGDLAVRSYKDDPWAQAAQKAMEAGLVVCVAAGNDGPSEMNISTPGIHPDAITVGALDDKGTIDRSDDAVAEFSSRGPTNIDGVIKPDLLAPGVNIYGPLAPYASIDDDTMAHDGSDYVAMSGTSMATPMVAGLAACIRQANPNLSQAEIKSIIVQSCDKYLDEPKNIQGAGLINAKKAIELALSWDISKDVGSIQTQDAKAADAAQPMAMLDSVEDRMGSQVSFFGKK